MIYLRIRDMLVDEALREERDDHLLNLVMLCKKLFEIDVVSLEPEWKTHTCNLLQLLLESLFTIKPEDPHRFPLIKSFKARQVCFNLFLEICNRDTKLTLTFLRKLVLGYEEFWVESVSSRQGLLEFRDLETAVGLTNLGNTCYVNSILQQLYFTDKFREELLTISHDHFGAVHMQVDQLGSSLHELQLLFARMKTSTLASISPQKFCQSFRGMNNQPINPALQQDAYEFLNCLLDTVEEGLPVDRRSEMMSQFKGKMVNEIRSLDPAHPFSSSRSESFATVLVDVKNCRTLSHALDRLVAQEIMDGDNALYREDLDKKVAVSRHSKFQELPETMTLVLKRFEYDQNTFQRIKLNGLFEFPLSLDFRRWMVDCAEACVYDLKGVVVHSGTSEFGHYYSHILRGKQWFEFNDKRVREISVNQHLLREEWFGGQRQLNMFTEMDFDWPNNSSKNAYILFYQRKSTDAFRPALETRLPEPLEAQIQNENKRILGSMLFADNQFNRFCGSFSEILSQLDLKKLLGATKSAKEAHETEKTGEDTQAEGPGNLIRDQGEKDTLKNFLEKKMMSLYLKIYGFKYEKAELLDEKAKSAINQKTGREEG